MEKVRYMISDASSLIRVESHVLRYWEEAVKAETENAGPDTEIISGSSSVPESADQKNLSRLEQFQIMMTQIVRRAIAENNEALGEEVSAQVGEKVIKEMNYLMREREEQEEERFRKLDEAIRSRQRRLRKEKIKKNEKKKDRPKKVRLRAGESVS